MEEGFVYILTNRNRTVLYVGATRYLKKRIDLHRKGKAALFTKKYNVIELVYYERYSDYHEAFAMEKKLKNWKRSWKQDLIKNFNPEWKDLFPKIELLTDTESSSA